MCCCRKEKSHDETMKFKLKVSPLFADKNPLDCTLFNSRQDGQLVQLEEAFTNKMSIPILIEKKMMFGRHLELHEIIKFLTGFERKEERILNLNGIYGVGCSTIARYAIKYVMNRHFFEDGAFYVDGSNKYSSSELLVGIGKSLQLVTNDKQDIVDMIRKFKILLLIDNSSLVIGNDFENLKDLLFFLIESTEHLKILLITD